MFEYELRASYEDIWRKSIPDRRIESTKTLCEEQDQGLE